MLVELNVLYRLLNQETIDLFRVIVKLIRLLRYVKSRLYTVYSDKKYSTIN
jgi:hypothetical protein